jgi:hypothetical protein
LKRHSSIVQSRGSEWTPLVRPGDTKLTISLNRQLKPRERYVTNYASISQRNEADAVVTVQPSAQGSTSTTLAKYLSVNMVAACSKARRAPRCGSAYNEQHHLEDRHNLMHGRDHATPKLTFINELFKSEMLELHVSVSRHSCRAPSRVCCSTHTEQHVLFSGSRAGRARGEVQGCRPTLPGRPHVPSVGGREWQGVRYHLQGAPRSCGRGIRLRHDPSKSRQRCARSWLLT